MPTTTIGRLDLYYEEAGRGEPLLLIMGLGADARAWLRQIPALARRYRTITFDNRGVGRSGKPPGPYSTAQMADEAAALLAHLGTRRAHVVGVSMGGMIAQELALRHPARVRGLVLACTYAAPGADELSARTRALEFFGLGDGVNGKSTDAPAAMDPLALLQFMLPTIFSERFIREELLDLLPELTAGLSDGFDVAALLAQVAACITHDTTHRLHDIVHPTLVLTGTADRLVAPRHSETLAAHIPDAQLVYVEGGSHAVNLENPDAFNAEVLRFLGRHPIDAPA